MTKRFRKVAEPVARAVGYKTKSHRTEQAAAQLERQRLDAQRPNNVAEENEVGGHRYMRP